MKRKASTISLLFALGALVSYPALALDGAGLYASKTCVACHGVGGDKPIMPNYPKLAGQNATYMITQMKDIKSGVRGNGMSAAMKGIMQMVTDDEAKAIAEWLQTK